MLCFMIIIFGIEIGLKSILGVFHSLIFIMIETWFVTSWYYEMEYNLTEKDGVNLDKQRNLNEN